LRFAERLAALHWWERGGAKCHAHGRRAWHTMSRALEAGEKACWGLGLGPYYDTPLAALQCQ